MKIDVFLSSNMTEFSEERIYIYEAYRVGYSYCY